MKSVKNIRYRNTNIVNFKSKMKVTGTKKRKMKKIYQRSKNGNNYITNNK